MNALVEPHGGKLVDQIVSHAEAQALKTLALTLPSIKLDGRESADFELIATGAASPLRGFLGSRDYASVLERLRLADGTVWPLPLTLAVSEELRESLAPGGAAALYDPKGRLCGVLQISELYRRDPVAEANRVYRTDSLTHPGVAYLLSRPQWLVAGEIRALPLRTDLPFAEHRFTPRALRERIRERGWKRVAGFQTRNPIHRAHEHLTKLALEFADGIVIHPLVGETKGDDVPAAVRFRAYEVLLDKYYPKERTLLAAFPAAMRYAGPREALFHALVRKNYGITHFIVGRDHAGVGSFYGPLEAQESFDAFEPHELGVSPLRFDATFFCKVCDNLASTRSCPHQKEQRLELSGTRVRQILQDGGDLPEEFTRPEIALILREHYANGGAPPASPTPGVPAQPTPPAAPQAHLAAPPTGFILWLTGLSGAGKSTLAAALSPQLARHRSIQILDGDEVRTYLSKGLGFSKEDRDTNIRRIGYVARLLARHGVGVIVAAISPYAQTRDEVRQLAAQDGTAFAEVHVHAELETLIQRDVKGLYKKALAGEIADFTGVSDPYEPPLSPDLVARSDRESVEQSATRILAALRTRGLIPHPSPESAR